MLTLELTELGFSMLSWNDVYISMDTYVYINTHLSNKRFVVSVYSFSYSLSLHIYIYDIYIFNYLFIYIKKAVKDTGGKSFPRRVSR